MTNLVRQQIALLVGLSFYEGCGKIGAASFLAKSIKTSLFVDTKAIPTEEKIEVFSYGEGKPFCLGNTLL